MFSVLVWGCNWILFMYGWFWPFRLIPLIRRKSLDFEKSINTRALIRESTTNITLVCHITELWSSAETLEGSCILMSMVSKRLTNWNQRDKDKLHQDMYLLWLFIEKKQMKKQIKSGDLFRKSHWCHLFWIFVPQDQWSFCGSGGISLVIVPCTGRCCNSSP